jgi:hypothetical protein
MTQISSAQQDEIEAGEERRAWVRYPSCQRTLCQESHAQTYDMWFMAALRELSQTGVSLVINRQFEPGSVIALEPIRAASNLTRLIHARVVHVRSAATGGWILGCEFTSPLTGEELKTLL